MSRSLWAVTAIALAAAGALYLGSHVERGPVSNAAAKSDFGAMPGATTPATLSGKSAALGILPSTA